MQMEKTTKIMDRTAVPNESATAVANAKVGRVARSGSSSCNLICSTESTPVSDDSDSASDFESESPAKKKLKRHHPDGNGTEDFRFSSRGGRLPNYFENEDMSVDDSDSDDDQVPGSDVPTEQVHEIEMVLDHHRDDERKADPEDNFQKNMVRPLIISSAILSDSSSSGSILSGKDTLISTTPTKRTTS